MSLGLRIKELRLQKGDSLQTVATAVGVSKPHIWELERGTTKNPSLKLIKKLAAYFGESVEYLTEENVEKSNDKMIFNRKIKEMNLTDNDLKALLAAAEILETKNKDDPT